MDTVIPAELAASGLDEWLPDDRLCAQVMEAAWGWTDEFPDEREPLEKDRLMRVAQLLVTARVLHSLSGGDPEDGDPWVWLEAEDLGMTEVGLGGAAAGLGCWVAGDEHAESAIRNAGRMLVREALQGRTASELLAAILPASATGALDDTGEECWDEIARRLINEVTQDRARTYEYLHSLCLGRAAVHP
jgi:hypothetical protein